MSIVRIFVTIAVILTNKFCLSAYHHDNNFEEHRACLRTLLDNSLEAFCVDEFNSPISCDGPGSWTPKISLLVQCMASKILEKGFQMPIYIPHAGNSLRKENMINQFKLSGITNNHVTWVVDYVVGNFTADDHNNFRSTDKHSAYEQEKCKEVLPQRSCQAGFRFRDTEKSVALKHYHIAAAIANETWPVDKHFSFALILEDDQVIPRNILWQIVALLLQSPPQLGVVMLDDSYFFDTSFAPPARFKDTFFPTSYVRNKTRTCGAYLMSLNAAKAIVNGDHYVPMYGPVDHQLTKALVRSEVLVHWAIPPVTCAGSQGFAGSGSSTGGITTNAGDRLGCAYCCNRYYNITTMLPKKYLTTRKVSD